MKNDDDTVLSDKQALEDTTAALMRSGGIPGALPVTAFELTDEASVAHAMAESAKLGTEAFCFYEIERAAARLGEFAGRTAGVTIQELPPNLHGNVVLSFTGYANDPRELWEIPEAITFCRGMLLGSSRNPDLVHAQATLAVLMDERPYIDLETGHAEDLFIHSAGGMWLVRTAFPAECWFGRGTQMLDFRMNAAIYNWLIGEGPPPGR